jgi:hypothetical protein
VTHRHSQHTVCDGVFGVTEEGYLPGVLVCPVSGTGSAVRVGQGVFSVFFIIINVSLLLTLVPTLLALPGGGDLVANTFFFCFDGLAVFASSSERLEYYHHHHPQATLPHSD